jgi:O-antigen/teichoic acid export membrane protein
MDVIESQPAVAAAGATIGRVTRYDKLFANGHLGELKGTSVRGGAITLIAQLLKFVVQTGSVMVVARLLSPEDFGLQGMVVAMTGVISLFRDAGLSLATVQRDVITHEQTSTLFWFNTALGAVLMLIAAAMAPVLVYFYNEPRLFWITIVSATAFFLNGLAVQHQALLHRSMWFVAMAKIEIAALIISAVVGIWMAWAGYGYWSLVGTTLANTLVGTVGSFIAVPWLPSRPTRNMEKGIGSMLHFGGTVTFNNLLVYLAYNADRVFLGRVWGSEAVGIYSRAYQLVNLPMQQLNTSIYNVAFPALSRIQNDAERLKRSFLTGYSVLLAINTPITIFTALYAEEAIRIMLGQKWLQATPVLQLLTPAILGFALVNPLGWFMMATGRTARSLRIAYLVLPVVIIGLLLGLPWGYKGVAAGFSAAVVLLVFPIVVWAIHGTGITIRNFLNTVKQPLLSGLVAGLCGYALRQALGSSVSWVVGLLIGAVVVFGVYAFLLLIVMGQKPLYVDLAKQVIQRKRGKGGEA